MIRPSPAVTTTRLRCTIGRSESPIQRIPHPSSAPATPMATAQAIVATVGSTAGGTDVRASEKLPRPVQLSSPTKTRAPMPEANNPGRATSVSVAPPMPAASMIRNAPSTGEPRSVLIAAKLPADAMIVRNIGGASLCTRCTVSAASPPPMAIRGASGPRTAPRLSVVSAARTTPGSSLSAGGPAPALNPNAGEWPPLPGRYRMVIPVTSPHRTNHGTGHHAGASPAKTSCGRSSNKNSWISAVSARNP